MRPLFFTMKIGEIPYTSLEKCAAACARYGYEPDGCQMFNFRAARTWLNLKQPLFRREGNCELFKAPSKFVELQARYGYSEYGEQYQA